MSAGHATARAGSSTVQSGVTVHVSQSFRDTARELRCERSFCCAVVLFLVEVWREDRQRCAYLCDVHRVKQCVGIRAFGLTIVWSEDSTASLARAH